MKNELLHIRSKSALSKLENKAAITSKLIKSIDNDWLVGHLTKNKEFFTKFILINCQLSLSTLKRIDKIYDIEWIILKNKKDIWSDELIRYLYNDNRLIEIHELSKFFKKWSDELIDEFITLKKNNFEEMEYISSNIHIKWTVELIKKYSDVLRWNYLSTNPSLPWSIDFIEMFIDKWVWSWLSCNRKIPWSEELITYFIDKWSWSDLTRNSSIDWDESLIDKFHENLKGHAWINLTLNAKIKWSENLIDKYGKYFTNHHNNNFDLNFGQIFLNAWDSISSSKKVPWSIKLIEKYEREFDENSSWNGYANEYFVGEYFPSGLSLNPNLPWSELLIDRFYEKWDWKYLQMNSGINWNSDMINRYEKEIYLPYFLWNENFLWTIELVEKVNEIIDSRNKEIDNKMEYYYPYDLFRDFHIGDVLSTICYRNNSPEVWKSGFVKYIYQNLTSNRIWHLSFNLSSKECVDWNSEFINEFKSLLSFSVLSSNNALPWTLELFREFADCWDYDELLKNETFTQSMMPFFDDELIEKVLSNLIKDENTSSF